MEEPYASLHKRSAEHLLADEYEPALRCAVPLLESNPQDALAWYVVARSLLALGESEVARRSLPGAIEALARDGKPILSIGLVKELAQNAPGAIDTQAVMQTIAGLYEQGSKLVQERSAAPPPLPVAELNEPLGGDEGALIEAAKKAMAVAWGDAMTRDTEKPVPYLPLFSALPAEDFISLADAFERTVLAPEEVVFEQDAPGDTLFVIAEGELEVSRRGADGETLHLARLGPGAFFGEMSLVSRAPRAATVKSVTTSVLLRADSSALESLAADIAEVGSILVAFCHARMLENLMRISPVLSHVPVAKRPDVIGLFDTDFFEAGSTIIEENSPGRGLHVIVSGEVEVLRDCEDGEEIIARLGPGDVFGEISLLMRRPSTATVRAVDDTAVLLLPAAEFQKATNEFPELLKGAFDIALDREAKNNSILATPAEGEDLSVLL